ncbi:UTRA domain-containing protein [Halomonas sp. B23F22_10]|uniref:UTRA domain-containing protein n=1 Tax=Halomonas sp. B23F22_10 TaxID=3459515 RepID=UPI00373E0FF8
MPSSAEFRPSAPDAALTPQAHGLHQALLSLLEEGQPAAGGRLPSERQMMARFATTRITLREALAQLEAEGRIYRENRRGWFVSPPRLRYDLLACLPFREMVESQQRRAETTLLEAGEVPAPAVVARRLGLAQGAPVQRIVRARRIDGRPVLYVEHHLRPECFPGILAFDLAARSLTDLYRREYAIRVSRVGFELGSTVLGGRAAEALRAAPGSPAQRITRINHDQNGRAVDCDDEYWRHDAIELTLSAAPQSRD